MAFPFKRRKGSMFDDFEDDFDRIREEMERMMEDMFKVTFEEMGEKGVPTEKDAKKAGPLVYGFSMKIGPEGKPIVQEFGNIKPKMKGAPDETEPLVDVIEEEKQVTVIADLPGVNKNAIHLKTTEDELVIKVEDPERKYSKQLKLPSRVKPESAKANYKNGVLEVKLDKVKPSPPPEKGKEIPVE